MTLKQFMYGAFVLPARALSGISDILFGSYQRDEEGKIKQDNSAKPGLLGLILDSVKYIGRNVSNFLTNHQQAIASAFWISATLAGAAALTVFLSPAALTFITTLEIAGYSIASVVGAEMLAQIGAVAALTAVASSAAVYVTAAFVNTINFFRELVANRKNDGEMKNGPKFEGENLDEDSNSKMAGNGLGKKQENNPEPAQPKNEEPPLHTGNPLNTNNKPKATGSAPVEEESSKHVASCK